MSLKAFLAAVRGYREKVGGGEGDATQPMTRGELDALMAEYPDTPADAAPAG
jgi:hypothetical protein